MYVSGCVCEWSRYPYYFNLKEKKKKNLCNFIIFNPSKSILILSWLVSQIPLYTPPGRHGLWSQTTQPRSPWVAVCSSPETYVSIFGANSTLQIRQIGLSDAVAWFCSPIGILLCSKNKRQKEWIYFYIVQG